MTVRPRSGRREPQTAQDRSGPDFADRAGFPAPPGLIAEATRKAGLIWVAAPAHPQPSPAWHHWHADAAYVLTGGSEEPVSWLVDTQSAEVIVPSKDSGGRLISWIARVTWLPPATDEWQRVVAELRVERLNSLDGEDELRRWARECDLVRLTPTGWLTEGPGQVSEVSGAAPPTPTIASTSGPLPFVVGRTFHAKAQTFRRLRRGR